MGKSTYKHYDLTASKRRSLNIASFGGVDYSSQKLQVASERAIDLLNFVYVDDGYRGTIQKRQGYTEKAVVPTVKYIKYPLTGNSPYAISSNASEKQFNGIWHFLAEDGEYHTVAHIGKLLFEIKNLNGVVVEFDLLTTTPHATGTDLQTYETTYEHLNQKSMAFVGNNRLWFLGGNKFMLIGFRSDGQLIYEPVEESQYTYVPTTTISITYANSAVKGRESFDYANNMTIWRKNTCLSGTGKSDEDFRRTKYFEYTLDAPIKTNKTKSDVEALALSKTLSSVSLDTQKELAKIHIKIEEIVTEE